MDAVAFDALFNVLAPILLMILIGFWIEKKTDTIETASMSALVMMVGTPALIFSTLTTTELPSDVLMQVSIGAICASAIAAVLASGLMRLLGYEIRAFLPCMTMPNSGNLGLPVVLLAFGNDGLAVGVSFYFVIAIIQYTIMPIVVAGQFSLARFIKEPLIWAVAAALWFQFSGAVVPQVIVNTTDVLGGMMIPVMIILLGAAIARLAIGDLKTAVVLSVVRLFIGLSAGLATITILGTAGVASGVIFLLAAMPSAVVTYVIAERYGRQPEKVAGVVVMSTLVTLVCLPALLWAALAIAQ